MSAPATATTIQHGVRYSWPGDSGSRYLLADDTAGAVELMTSLAGEGVTRMEPVRRAVPEWEIDPDGLGDLWRRYALLHHNEEVGDEIVALALETLAPRLSAEDAAEAFERLKHDLLRLQNAEDPCAVLDVAETGPDHDPETYVNHLRGCVDDALHALINAHQTDATPSQARPEVAETAPTQ